MVYLKIKKFINGKPILYGLNSFKAPFGVTMTEADVLPDAKGKKYITEGMFVAAVGDEIRFLPRTRLASATATNSKSVTLKAPCFSFKVGDVLYGMAGNAEVTFAGTFTAGDVYTLRIGNQSYSVTAPASPTADNVVDAFISGNAAAFTTAGITATQKGTSGTITINATDSHTIYGFSSNPAVTIQVQSTSYGNLGNSLSPLGVIASIALPNAQNERVVTLVDNAAYVLPANSPVGVHVDKILGIYPDPLDYTDEPVMHIAPIYGADGVYENNLPYCDESIKREMVHLNINKRFYKKA